MRFVSLLLVSLLCADANAQSVRHVPQHFASIQSAIDSSADGDVILVAPGTYHERIEFRGRSVRVQSTRGSAITILDGGNLSSVVRFVHGEGRGSVLDGFTVQHGSHPTNAGGVHIENASPTLRNNVIVDNVGGRDGHGISIVNSANALIVGNSISFNRSLPSANGSGGGGGIGVRGASLVEIRDNQIVSNAVTRFSSGGGIFLDHAGAPVIVGNRIEGNSARLEGGGIAIFGHSGARIEGNLIVRNQVTQAGKGGGVQWLLLPGSLNVRLINNTIIDNHAESGAGIYADGEDQTSLIANNLVTVRAGYSAIECGDFYDLAAPQVLHNNATGGRPYAEICEPARGQDGNIAVSPRFETGSYALAATSAGIDAGIDTVVDEITDLAGKPRRADGNGDRQILVDIGAYEYATTMLSGG